MITLTGTYIQTVTLTGVVDGFVAYDYYVDSVNGDDANDGLTEDTAFASIGALPTLEASDRVGLARGSHWREQLTIPASSIQIGVYGEGDKPILDASDIITGWVKTDGQTNVYEATISATLATVANWINAWEDDLFLVRASSLANCDATPGSYRVSTDVGSGATAVTLYVHATDSGNPASNGSVYEAGARQYGINAFERTNVHITGITMRRGVNNNGSCIVGRSCVLTDCRFEDGSKHNVLYADGCILTDCVAEGRYGQVDSTFYVFNENTPAGLGITHIRCQAIRRTTDPVGVGAVTAFFGHNNVNGSFGVATFIDCEVQRCNGFAPGNVDEVIIDGGLVNEATVAVTAAGITRIRNGFQYKATSGTRRFLNFSGINVEVHIDGVLVCVNGGVTMQLDGPNAVVNVTNSIFKTTTGTLFNIALNTITVNSHNNIIEGYGDHTVWPGSLTGAVFESDNNIFASNSVRTQILGTTYTTLSAYVTATGRDANSTVGGAGVGNAACV